MWKADPDEVNIIDVRIPEEYIFVGHARDGEEHPAALREYQWDAEKDEPSFEPNAAFVVRVQELLHADRHAPLDVPLRRT